MPKKTRPPNPKKDAERRYDMSKKQRPPIVNVLSENNIAPNKELKCQDYLAMIAAHYLIKDPNNEPTSPGSELTDNKLISTIIIISEKVIDRLGDKFVICFMFATIIIAFFLSHNHIG